MNRDLCEVTEEATEISGCGTFQVEGTAGAKGLRPMNLRNKEASGSRMEKARAIVTGDETGKVQEAWSCRAS